MRGEQAARGKYVSPLISEFADKTTRSQWSATGFGLGVAPQ